MLKSKELQIKAVLEQYDVLLKTENNEEIAKSINQEYSVLKRLLADISWVNLEDEEKQKKRKAMLVILDKWSYEEGSIMGSAYEKCVVDLYDHIEMVLAKLTHGSAFIIRLRAMLIIEKNFINEQSEFSKMRHMDFYMWSNLFSQNKHDEHYGLLELDELNNLFKAMYNVWPKRPYKETL